MINPSGLIGIIKNHNRDGYETTSRTGWDRAICHTSDMEMNSNSTDQSLKMPRDTINRKKHLYVRGPFLPHTFVTYSFLGPGLVRSSAKLSNHQLGTGKKCLEGPGPSVSFGGIDSSANIYSD